ncbi:phosphodiesterase [Mycolicibacterium sediminis]|uniref:3',5'-cyclic adenosine monophosphate phosphodiesterase CpdA n=1 Tax=Mycolicibacterium sediminis TaxID=1286180 RepID=A0A7I7QUP3_9MYCO|nr:phosphodiesterase [Mycolicibacterium sediminis]BBY29992.1 3',5'-cyclic adenosine monophosphate phosphodiesterase CpdA [Mycolicibacterium sediminis]
MLIAQLSDLHVCPHGMLYHGVVDSNGALVDAIDHLLAMDRRPDLVLLTGDLVDEGRPEEYEYLREILLRLTIPFLLIPGNHDDRENLRTAFSDHRYLPAHGPLHYCVDDHPVRIIGLDSTVPGSHHGHVDPDGLTWLADTLAANTTKPTLLMLHHPPIVSGIDVMDQYRYVDGAGLRAVVERVGNVEIVLCGHVHRSMLTRWADTVLCACPSTVTEIDLRLSAGASPSSHAGPRGCMLHLWNERHGLVSHTSQIGVFDGPYPFV